MAIFMAAIMTGCKKSVDEQILDEVFEDIPTVTGTTSIKDVSVTDIETFTTTKATTSKMETAASETEVTFDYDDSIFPAGEWVDVSETDETFYSFDGNGRLEIGLQTHSIFGKYTFEDNTLTLILDIGFETENYVNFAFDVQKEENGYRLYYNSEKSMGAIDLPDMDSVTQTSDQELIAGLSDLISGFENRESIFLEFYEIWYANSRYS